MDHEPRRELVTGDYPDLEAAFAAHVRELRRAEPLAPLVVLVPTNLLRNHLRRTLADNGLPHLNVRFLSFNNLVSELVTPDLVKERLIALPMFADELLMAEACQGHGDQFYFRALVDRPGMHRVLLGSIADLKEAGVTVAALDTVLKRVVGLHPTSVRKLESLLTVWRRYEALMAHHRFVDDADRHALAARLADRHPLLRASQQLIVYGIYDFKGIQVRLVLAASCVTATTVYFPFQPTASWEFAEPSRRVLLDAGFTERQLAATHETRSQELQRICDRLFINPYRTTGESAHSPPAVSPAPAQPADDGSRPPHEPGLVASSATQILSLPGETREAAEIPRLALELARKHGLRFCEVGVLLRSPRTSLRGIADAFELAGIPPHCPDGVELRLSRAARSLILMLRAIHEQYTRRTLMELVTFADLDFESLAGQTDPPTTVWDALSMRANIVRGRDQWLSRLGSLRARLGVESKSHTRDICEPRIDPPVVDGLILTIRALIEQLESVRTADTWGELVVRAEKVFRVTTRTSDDRDRVLAALAALGQLEPIQPKADLGLFSRLVSGVLEAESVARRGDEPGGPTVIGLMQARGVPYRAVILPGLIERNFPQPPALDPILLDHERRALNAALPAIDIRRAADDGHAATGNRPTRGDRQSRRRLRAPEPDTHSIAIQTPRLSEKARQVLEERLLFRLAVGAARERLILTYPRIESEVERARIPSHFLLRLVEAIGSSESPAAPLKEPGRFQSAPVGSAPVEAPGVMSLRRPRKVKRAADQLRFSFFTEGEEAAGDEPAACMPPASLALARPSTFELLGQWPGHHHIPLSHLAPKPGRAVTLFEFDLGHALTAVPGERVCLAGFATVAPHFARALHAEQVRWSVRHFTAYDGRIEDADLLAALRSVSPLRAAISPSRVEDYARCPFHFYMHNLLRLEEQEEPEGLSRADPVAKGKMIHEVLAEFLGRLRDEGRFPLAESALDCLLDIARRHFADFEASGACGPALNWRHEREQLEQFFREFVTREIERQRTAGWRPAWFEMRFGYPDVEPGLSPNPPRVDLGDGRFVEFHGVIDRVDLQPEEHSLYVIDYKGRKLPHHGKDGTGRGRAIQLHVYLLGAQSALKPRGDFRPAGACYVSYQPGVEPRKLPDIDDAAWQRLRNVLRTIVDGIDTGLFMQYTGHKACEFCPYDRVCMGIQESISRMKQADPAAEPFLDMKSSERRLVRGGAD